MSTDDFDEEFSDYEREIFRNIDEYGCHVTYVYDPDSDAPSFAYSTGFPHAVDQGEVITFGLPQDMMQFMVNQTLRQCRDQGLVLSDGLRISGLLEGFDVVARRIPPHNIIRDYFNSAMWHHVGRYSDPLTKAYQLVWPGAADGLFPWDGGCASDVIALQPALYETRLH